MQNNDEQNTTHTIQYDDEQKYVGETINNGTDIVQHGKGTYYFNDGDKYEGQWNNDVFVNGREYYKKPVENEKYVYFQINELNAKPEFTKKYQNRNADFIYGDNNKKKDNIINPNDNYEHLKIHYENHGRDDRSLKNKIPNELFKKYVKKGLKSIYISSISCHGGFYEIQPDKKKGLYNNLFDILGHMMVNTENKDCIGFLSLTKIDNTILFNQTTNKNKKVGLKRIPLNKSTETKNLSSSKYDKNDDFEYYCMVKENDKYHLYQIPAELCYWREHLIDDNKFMKALNALKNNQDYTFDAKVILNDGNNTETTKTIVLDHNKVEIKECKIERSITARVQEINNKNVNYNAHNIVPKGKYEKAKLRI